MCTTRDQPKAILFTTGDLLTQSYEIIEQYIEYFGIYPPDDTLTTRQSFLKRLSTLHPDPTTVIPILPHLVSERLSNGKIQLHLQPTTLTPGALGSLPLSPYKESNTFALEEEQRSSNSSPSPQDIEDNEKYTSNEEEEEEEPFCVPFPTPFEEEGEAAEPVGSCQRAFAGSHEKNRPSRRRIPFIYPPTSILFDTPVEEDLMDGASFLRPSWLDKMYTDLDGGRKDVINELAKAKEVLTGAIEAAFKAKMDHDAERQETNRFVSSFGDIVGDEWKKVLWKEITRERSPSDRSDDEDGKSSDEDEESVDGGDESNDYKEKPKGEGEKTIDDDDELADVGGNLSDHEVVKEVEHTIGESSQQALNKTTSIANKRTLRTCSPNALEAEPHKRRRSDDDGFNDGCNSHKRVKSSNVLTAPDDHGRRVTSIVNQTTLPSLKRSRDHYEDNSDDSELEVENSVRLSLQESSLGFGTGIKRARNDPEGESKDRLHAAGNRGISKESSPSQVGSDHENDKEEHILRDSIFGTSAGSSESATTEPMPVITFPIPPRHLDTLPRPGEIRRQLLSLMDGMTADLPRPTLRGPQTSQYPRTSSGRCMTAGELFDPDSETAEPTSGASKVPRPQSTSRFNPPVAESSSLYQSDPFRPPQYRRQPLKRDTERLFIGENGNFELYDFANPDSVIGPSSQPPSSLTPVRGCRSSRRPLPASQVALATAEPSLQPDEDTFPVRRYRRRTLRRETERLRMGENGDFEVYDYEEDPEYLAWRTRVRAKAAKIGRMKDAQTRIRRRTSYDAEFATMKSEPGGPCSFPDSEGNEEEVNDEQEERVSEEGTF